MYVLNILLSLQNSFLPFLPIIFFFLDSKLADKKAHFVLHY